MRDDRRRRREILLPASRVCPHCSKYKPSSRQWIALRSWVGCKSCWLLQGKPGQGDAPLLISEVAPAESRTSIVGNFKECCTCCNKIIEDRSMWNFSLEVCRECESWIPEQQP